MPIVTKDRIIFNGNDWVGGLNSQYGKLNLVMGNPIALATAFNPHRPNGIASPGYLNQSVTNSSTVTGTVVGGINKYASGSSITKGILIDNSGKIQELTYLTRTITPSGTFPYSISHGGHSSVVGEDIVAYTANVSGTATRLAFYSFRDGTDWDIGSYDYATTFNDDFMSTVPATPLASPYLTGGKSAPHPMIVGADDVLYVGDRNFLHGFDGATGTDGTFYAAVLTLPAGYTITSFSKTETFLVIYAYRQDQTNTNGDVYGEATAFFWDYLSLDPTKTIPLDDNYVNGGFLFNGIPACFTSGRGMEGWEGSTLDKSSDLRIYDGSGFPSVVSFDGTLPIYRGVDVLADEIMWNSAGTVFSYANKVKENGYKLNKVGEGNGTTSGFLRTMAQDTQYVSSSTSGLQYFLFPSYASSSTFSTILVQPPQDLGQVSRLKGVEIRLYTLGNATNIIDTLNVIYSGNSTTTSQTIIDDGFFTSYNKMYITDTSGNPLKPFNRIGLFIQWQVDGGEPPLIDSVILHFEPININNV